MNKIPKLEPLPVPCPHCGSNKNYVHFPCLSREEIQADTHTPDRSLNMLLPKLIEMGRLCLKLGRVNRATFHEDGVTPESDTDHTVMLGVLACSFAEVLAPHLDLGLVSQFSQVHDFVEVHAGDTMSLGIDKQGLDDQAKREAAALISIGFEFSASLPWLPSMITAYESQATPEARFVKVLDKVMPCIAHLLNGGVTVKKLGFTAAQLRKTHEQQRWRIAESYGADQDAAMALLRAIHELLDRASIT